MPASADSTLPQPDGALERAFRAVWDENRAAISAKLALIEQAVAALRDAELDDELREQARSCAHMLNGSLGMFGFERAAEAARELQSRLPAATPAQSSTLAALAASVRRGLEPELDAPPAGVPRRE